MHQAIFAVARDNLERTGEEERERCGEAARASLSSSDEAVLYSQCVYMMV